MKKPFICISFLLAALTLLSGMVVSVSAAEADASDALWEQKKAYYESYKYTRGEGGEYSHWTGTQLFIYDPLVQLDCQVFFYTKAASEMTFSYYNCNEEHGKDYEKGSEVVWALQAANDDKVYTAEVLSNDRLTALFRKQEDVPLLYTLVQELKIPKEDLIEANRKAKEDPYCIRSLHPELTDEQFKRFFVNLPRPLAAYMIEAMYLENREDSLRLLCYPWATRVQGKPLIFADIAGFEESVSHAEYDLNEILSMIRGIDVQKEHFLDFLDGCKVVAEKTSFFGWDNEAALARIEYVRSSVSAPQTGEHTVLYALVAVSALSALAALAALCVGRRKRRI